jgi:hypothetical protein
MLLTSCCQLILHTVVCHCTFQLSCQRTILKFGRLWLQISVSTRAVLTDIILDNPEPFQVNVGIANDLIYATAFYTILNSSFTNQSVIQYYITYAFEKASLSKPRINQSVEQVA